MCVGGGGEGHLLTDLEVKVTDLINEMSISHQSVIRKLGGSASIP